MKFVIQIISIIFFVSSPLSAYQDQDIDGVDDHYDKCPNTPFDQLVDERGCPLNKNTPSKLTLQIGSDLSFNTLSDISNNLNVYANYHYNKWDFSLSSSNYDHTNLNTTDDTESNLYLTVGHLFEYKKLNTKLSIGTKFSFIDEKDRQRDNDFYASLYLDYKHSSKQNIFLYYNYTLSGQSNNEKFNDFSSYSLGTGYMFTPKWYSAISYNHSTALSPNAKGYQALSWFNAYNFTKELYISCNYAHTLNDSAARHILSLNLGVHFE